MIFKMVALAYFHIAPRPKKLSMNLFSPNQQLMHLEMAVEIMSRLEAIVQTHACHHLEKQSKNHLENYQFGELF